MVRKRCDGRSTRSKRPGSTGFAVSFLTASSAQRGAFSASREARTCSYPSPIGCTSVDMRVWKSLPSADTAVTFICGYER
jgi:hypothetical protein